jgi:hypothetical protein
MELERNVPDWISCWELVENQETFHPEYCVQVPFVSVDFDEILLLSGIKNFGRNVENHSL